MSKLDVLKKLRKGFNLPEEGEFDPELFLLRLGMTIHENTKSVERAVQGMQQDRENSKKMAEQMQVLEKVAINLGEMNSLHDELKKAISERRIEKVQVEHIREIPPSKIQVEVKQPQAVFSEESKTWLGKAWGTIVKGPIDDLKDFFTEEIRLARKAENAIAVRLVDKMGEDFYTAMLTAVSGGFPDDYANSGNQALILEALNTGQTIKTASGTASSSGNNTIVAAVSGKRIKVIGMKLTYISTTAQVILMQSGAGGTEIDRQTLQSPASVSVGLTESINPPACLFQTAASALLNMNLSQAVAVQYRFTYFEGD